MYVPLRYAIDFIHTPVQCGGAVVTCTNVKRSTLMSFVCPRAESRRSEWLICNFVRSKINNLVRDCRECRGNFPDIPVVRITNVSPSSFPRFCFLRAVVKTVGGNEKLSKKARKRERKRENLSLSLPLSRNA